MANGTNCWAFLHKPLADSWEEWWTWYKSGRAGPEPNIAEWDKSRIRTMIHQDFAFSAYNPAQLWDGREWRMLNFYDISRGNINAGIQQHGDAFAGGDFNALGYWTWQSRDDAQSEKIPQIEYRPDIAILFMPNAEMEDINLAAGQPPRDLSA